MTGTLAQKPYAADWVWTKGIPKNMPVGGPTNVRPACDHYVGDTRARYRIPTGELQDDATARTHPRSALASVSGHPRTSFRRSYRTRFPRREASMMSDIMVPDAASNCCVRQRPVGSAQRRESAVLIAKPGGLAGDCISTVTPGIFFGPVERAKPLLHRRQNHRCSTGRSGQ
jgi:hypothetical protein